MRHVNINRIITVSFLEDITTTDVRYEDSKGNNMDKLIFKNKVSGTRPKSLVVGNIKYHIHYNDPKIEETRIERHPYISTTGRSTDAMKDKSLLFKLRGRCVNPRKECMSTKLQTGITEIDKLIEGRMDPSSFMNFTAHIPNPCVDVNALYNNMKYEHSLEQQLLLLAGLVNADKALYEIEDFDRSFLIDMQFKIYRAASSRVISLEVMNYLRNVIESATSVKSKVVADTVYVCYKHIISTLGYFEKESPTITMDKSAYFMYPESIVIRKLNMIASFSGPGHHRKEEDETTLGNLSTHVMKKYTKDLGISFKNIKGDTDGE